MVTLNPGCQGIAFGILELHSLRSGLGQTEGARGQDRQTDRQLSGVVQDRQTAALECLKTILI